MDSTSVSDVLGGIHSGNPFRRIFDVRAGLGGYLGFGVRPNAGLSGNIETAATAGDNIPRLSMPHNVVSISKEEHKRIVQESGHRRANLPKFTIVESKISIPLRRCRLSQTLRSQTGCSTEMGQSTISAWAWSTTTRTASLVPR